MKSAIAIIAATVLLLQGVHVNCREKKPLTFKVVAMAQIVDLEAKKAGFHTTRFGSTLFKASNGATLSVMYGDFKDAEEAKHFLDWNVQKSWKVLSQTTKSDPDGKPIEYRAELVAGEDHSVVELMWVVGVAVHWIQARNLDDAVELEKQYRH